MEDCSADFKLVYLRLRTVGGAAVYGWVWLLDLNAEKAGVGSGHETRLQQYTVKMQGLL